MKQPKIIRSAALVGICTLISRLLGVIRQMLMAAEFGTSLWHSAFVVAFRIPNLLRRLFGEGAFSAAMIPVYSETIINEGREKADEVAGRIITIVSLLLTVIVLVGIAFLKLTPIFLNLGVKTSIVFHLTSIMFPYGLYICVVAIFMAILNTFHHFFVPAITPIILNLVWIAAILVSGLFGNITMGEKIEIISWSIIIAGCLQLLVQVPVLNKHSFKPLIKKFFYFDIKTKTIFKIMFPVALSMGAYQVNVMIDGIIALWVAPWAPAALACAETIVYLPLGLFGTSFGTVLLPAFSHQAAEFDTSSIRTTLQKAINVIFIFTVPSSFALVVLAPQIIQMLYQWPGKAFDADSTTWSARAMCFYAPGILFFAINKAVVPLFYAFKKPWIHVRISVLFVVINLILNIIFVLTWPVGYKHAGLAFSTTLCALCETIVFIFIIFPLIGGDKKLLRNVGKTAFLVFIASGIMSATLLPIYNGITSLFTNYPQKINETIALGGTIILGVIVYMLLLLLSFGTKQILIFFPNLQKKNSNQTH